MATSSSSVSLLQDTPLRLFGAPYQFTDEVDPKYDSVFKYLGRSYGTNIMSKAPIVTIIPGEPQYLAGADSSDKETITNALLSQSSSMNGFSNFLSVLLGDDATDVRYYDFKATYTEYYKYVNSLCRVLASLLDLTKKGASDGEDDTIDGVAPTKYSWNGFLSSNYTDTTDSTGSSTTIVVTRESAGLSANAKRSKLKSYVQELKTTYRNLGLSATSGGYDKETKSYTITLKTKDSSTSTSDSGTPAQESSESNEESMIDMLTSRHFLMFYVDADSSGVSETHSNETSTSIIRSTMDSMSSTFKELAFVMNSGGMEGATEYFTDSVDQVTQALATALGGTDNGITTALSRIFDLTGNVVNGENVIVPDVYTNSTFAQSYSFTIHLKSLYGSRFGWFWDVGVPLMHLLALGLPRQASANTYSSPFLVKAFYDGVFSCNMGIVSSLEISKAVSTTSWTADGLPNEIDVTVQITDLYSDLSISSSANPIMFYNNTSLIDYLFVTAGLSLVTPSLKKKIDLYINSFTSAVSDIPANVAGIIDDVIYSNFTSAFIQGG